MGASAVSAQKYRRIITGSVIIRHESLGLFSSVVRGIHFKTRSRD